MTYYQLVLRHPEGDVTSDPFTWEGIRRLVRCHLRHGRWPGGVYVQIWVDPFGTEQADG